MNAAETWQARYEAEDTPWEKGRAHPALPWLVQTYRNIFRSGQRVLVPGCGTGHDAAVITEATGPETVVGLDLAESALTGARAAYPTAPILWEKGDFFQLAEERAGEFDLLWEHTCFCAIDPSMREDYAKAAASAVRRSGYFLAVFFLNPDMPAGEGPPFGVERTEIHRLFGDNFDLCWDLPPIDTYHPERTGRETVMLWRRK